MRCKQLRELKTNRTIEYVGSVKVINSRKRSTSRFSELGEYQIKIHLEDTEQAGNAF
ncbi:hypothetical protein ACWOD8_00855 [Enterococcus plantarum]|uniref:hypothetical protein n=1 Tax=Enterococcus plantarum TaxID=1077675 RepID=UPI0014288F83|nr:hypothetical protein [Enterococcus plantarum]